MLYVTQEEVIEYSVMGGVCKYCDIPIEKFRDFYVYSIAGNTSYWVHQECYFLEEGEDD